VQPPPFIDIEAGRTPHGKLRLYGIPVALGNMWMSEVDSTGNFSHWTVWNGPELLATAAGIAMANQHDEDHLSLFVVTTALGIVQVSQAYDDVWSDWVRLI
jgi:hypothetical protein